MGSDYCYMVAPSCISTTITVCTVQSVRITIVQVVHYVFCDTLWRFLFSARQRVLINVVTVPPFIMYIYLHNIYGI